MRRGIILTWLVGEGIIIYRAFKNQPGGQKAPPMPGELLIVSALFVMLALIGEISDDSAKFATLLGAGLDIAALMNLFQAQQTGQQAATNPPVKPKTPAPKGGK